MENKIVTTEPAEAELLEPGKGFSRGKILAAAESRQFSRNFGAGTIIDDGPPKEKRRPGKDGVSALEIRPRKDIADSPELQDLSSKIKAEFEAVSRCSLEAAKHMVELGHLLDRARASVPHGGWLKWIEQSCGVKKSSVYNYLNLAGAVQRGEIDLPTVGSLGLKAALATITKPKVKAVEDSPAVGKAAVVKLDVPAELQPAVSATGAEMAPPCRHIPDDEIDAHRRLSGRYTSGLVQDIEQLVRQHMPRKVVKSAMLAKIAELKIVVAAFEKAFGSGAE